MKHSFFILTLLVPLKLLPMAQPDQFQVIIKPSWCDLECDAQKCQQFGGKWILVGRIIFKKKSKEPVELNKLALKWVGQKIDNLIGSLYTATSDSNFMPIEENLICDGQWNKTNQTLSLKFKDLQSLGFINSYYLVLTIPPHLESMVQQGHFEIDHHQLPEQFKESLLNNHLRLSLDAFNSITCGS